MVIDSIDIYGSFLGDNILKELSNSKPQCGTYYEVDLMVTVTTKPMMDKLMEIFDILDEMRVILPE